jgi:V/A-type H+-transporting ATPase subunit E
MAEELKELIEKIQQEGIDAAEEKSRDIQKEARRKADAMVAEARKEADKIVADAKARIAQMQESSRVALQQAGRDFLLELRNQIQSLLERVILMRVREALTPQELAQIISGLLQGSVTQESSVVITLNPADLEKLTSAFAGGVKEEMKKGIVLQGADDIRAGFTISFDSGKSHFDFTDESLAGYIKTALKPKLAEILG